MVKALINSPAEYITSTGADKLFKSRETMLEPKILRLFH